MKWIPALAIVVGFINCDEQAPAPPPEPVVVVADVGTVEPEVAPPAEDALFKRPLLYEVTKTGNHRTSWLFGAVNAKFDMDFDSAPASVKFALTQSSHAMFEVPTGSAAHRDRTKLMAMNDGSVRKEVGSARFKKLIKVTGYNAGVIDVMKPWVVYLSLEEKLAGDPPMDEAFESFAASYRKRPVYLETVREQVEILDRTLEFEVLSGLIDGFDDHLAQAEQAAAAYREGNDDDLKAAIFPPDDARTTLHQKLMDARVPIWATKLGTQFEGDATFAVVSARYLLGPNNLIDALRANGWTVERVKR